MCMTEAWAGAYFQVAAAALLFGIGIPSLVLQAIVSEDIRRIVHRNQPLLKYFSIVAVAVYTIITLTFIWVHPCDNIGDSATIFGIHPRYWDWAAWVMTVAIIGIGGTWYLQVMHRRDRILKRLERECKRTILRTGAPSEQALSDIQYLGEQSQTETESKQALNVIDSIAERIQSHKSYNGYGLSGIIEALESILKINPSITNAAYGVTISHTMMSRLLISNNKLPPPNTVAKLSSSPDMAAALRSLKRIGIIAINEHYVRPTLKVIDAATQACHDSDHANVFATTLLLELGATALNCNEYLSAMAAFRRLEVLFQQASSSNKLSPDLLAAYLGLLAHFWSSGSTTHKMAMQSLKTSKFNPKLKVHLESAREYHIKTARFSTADKLAKMIKKLPKKLLDQEQ